MPGQPLGMRLSAAKSASGEEVTRAAVLGRPIAHSLSPTLHNAAYEALGLPWRYAAIDCGVAELRKHVQEALNDLPPETSPLDRIMTAVEAHLRHELEQRTAQLLDTGYVRLSETWPRHAR